ncbi:MAG: hypothetical protein ABDH19_01730 [Thermodesulfovibrio sp.]
MISSIILTIHLSFCNSYANFKYKKIKYITGVIILKNVTKGNNNLKKLHKNDIIRLLTNKGYFDPKRAVTNDEYIKKTFEKTGNFIVRSLVGTVIDSSLEKTPLRFISAII